MGITTTISPHSRENEESICYLTGKNSNKTPISVQVQKEGKTINLQDPDEIAQAFQKHNKTHFAQANGGFFNSIEVKQVVEPQKVPEIFQTNEVQEERILQILKNIQVQEIKSSIDPEEWKKKFKPWSERTRTSPSGAHLGHYKSLLRPVMDGEGETALNTVLHDIQIILFSIQLSVVNLAIKLGKPLQRWKKAVNLVIPKIKGINNISKFCNIHIYECDLNAFLSINPKQRHPMLCLLIRSCIHTLQEKKHNSSFSGYRTTPQTDSHSFRRLSCARKSYLVIHHYRPKRNFDKRKNWKSKR